MSEMTVNQRMQLERPELTQRNSGIRRAPERGLAAYSVAALAVLGLLGYAAAQALSSWAMWVVLGGIVMTTIGLIIAVSPSRRA